MGVDRIEVFVTDLTIRLQREVSSGAYNTEFKVKVGHVTVPTGPGLGITVDERTLERQTLKRETVK